VTSYALTSFSPPLRRVSRSSIFSRLQATLQIPYASSLTGSFSAPLVQPLVSCLIMYPSSVCFPHSPSTVRSCCVLLFSFLVSVTCHTIGRSPATTINTPEPKKKKWQVCVDKLGRRSRNGQLARPRRASQSHFVCLGLIDLVAF
jgi:hypothetical protein